MTKRDRRNVLVEGEKLRGADKVRRIPVKVIPTTELPKKPDWIRVKIQASPKIAHIKNTLRNQYVKKHLVRISVNVLAMVRRLL